ncbi:centrosomal protein of 85 kda [Plakobranchus ocellatus]|uniref:Centrosomal protein of 85 kDa n=1 Tax=Plakobranchus ocellatus TaxID=259542 RepID=A0AAV4DEP4_9GAST|nr:centrosomal protein of 85 kda [Plakobranchus ocellatus]
MNDKGELTNVPDYQKIRQTTQSAGGPGWGEDVETLVPSPVVRPPIPQASSSTSPRQQGLMQVGGGFPLKSSTQQQQHHSAHDRNSSLSPDVWESKLKQPDGIGGTSKASWEAQSQPYNASKYNDGSTSPAFIPQGYSRQVTKYIDANGVERRFIRSSAASPNRRSYTEGLLLKGEGSGLGSLPGVGAALLRNATSQKNLYQDYSSAPAANVSDSNTRGEFGNFIEDRKAIASRHSFTNVRNQQKMVGGSSYSSLYQSPGGASGDDQWKQIGGGHLVLKKHQEGLRHWQQQHQEELLHQHLETQALYETPSNQSLLLSGTDQNFTKHSVQDEPPARWEPVRRAADNIIREKNMIIDKLKNRILELEEDFKESESKLRQALISRDDDADIAKDKLQELQHSNATLKERMSEERTKKNSEIDDLELKLGSAEHEIQKLKEVLRNKATDVSDVQAQLLEKTREAEVWHEKFKESCEGHQDLKKKLDSLQRYLNELPTVEESQMQAQQLLSLREENVALKTRSEGLDKKLSQVRKVITARDFRIRDLEEKERDLEQKLLETTHLRLRQMEVKYQGELKSEQERLTQEEETVMSLRNEVADRENQIAKMKKSMKDLGVQNQEQLEENLMLKQQLRHSGISPRQHHQHHLDDASSGSSGYSSGSFRGRSRSGSGDTSTSALQRQFMQQLSLCFFELQALVNVCSQRARGEDPDISVLLGVKHPGSDEAAGGDPDQFETSGDHNKAMSQWLTKLGEMRREVDRLRARICNKYAEDMGDNITCATQ